MQRVDQIAEAFSKWKRTWELSRQAKADLDARIAAANLHGAAPPPVEAFANATALTQEADRLLLIASHLLHDLAPAAKGSATRTGTPIHDRLLATRSMDRRPDGRDGLDANRSGA